MRRWRNRLDIFLAFVVLSVVLYAVYNVAGPIALWMLLCVGGACIFAHFYFTKVGIGPTRDGLDD